MMMKVSPAGRRDITQREGKRLVAYKDSVDVWTIGVGHTGRMSLPVVYAGMRITDAQSDAFLAADLAPVEAALNRVLKVPVTQNQFDALASFLFNVGVGWAGVGGHPVASIFTRLNAGDVKGAADAFDLFRKPPEIIGRRNGEKAQFQRPDALGAADGARPHPAPAIPPLKPEPALAGTPSAPAPLPLSDPVARLQSALLALGYTQLGKADGFVGPKTLAAVAAFTNDYQPRDAAKA